MNKEKEPVVVSSVRILNIREFTEDANSLSGAYLYIVDGNRTETSSYKWCGSVPYAESGKWYEVECAKDDGDGLKGQELYILLNGDKCLNFCGLEVYGELYTELDRKYDNLNNYITASTCVESYPEPVYYGNSTSRENYDSDETRKESLELCTSKKITSSIEKLFYLSKKEM